ncbi:hypothetical protein O181_024419 [Austropuccinia psidii MF-1]|uniref:Uncharacterized protein n=1 Tax=Austropuccinia psidii MF-1 TaxID=1389203 RepID=A0A9Q3GZN5_9BASI|nr:hypothetical protein [Austropuccinia psidii MF-1]
MEAPVGKYKFSFFPDINIPPPLLQPSPAFHTTSSSTIIILDTPVGSPTYTPVPPRTQLSPPTRCKAPLIPTIRLCRNSLTCNQPS